MSREPPRWYDDDIIPAPPSGVSGQGCYLGHLGREPCALARFRTAIRRPKSLQNLFIQFIFTLHTVLDKSL
jgi:hypothetical protein